MGTMFSALESSRLARTVRMARDKEGSLVLAGTGALDAWLRVTVLSVFPFKVRFARFPRDATKIGRVLRQFQDRAKDTDSDISEFTN